MKRKSFLLTERLKNSGNMRRVGLFLVTMAVCCCMASEGWAQTVASGTTGQCTWAVTGTSGNYTLTISGNGAMGDYTYYYDPAPWHSYGTDIKTLDIQQGVTAIGTSAFSECSSFTSVTIPNSITSIGTNAFARCSSLTDIYVSWNFPLYISTNPFGEYTMGEDEWVYTITLHVPAGTAHSYRSSFWNGLNIPVEESELPCSNPSVCGGTRDHSLVWAICEGTLMFTGYEIPDFSRADPSYLESYAPWYSYRNDIENVEINTNISSIGSYAFWACNNITSITIPASVSQIGVCAFSNCTKLEMINVAANNMNYASTNGDLYNKQMTTLVCVPAGKSGTYTVPGNVKTINSYAFYGCINLTSVIIPNTVTRIQGYAFDGCTKLESITFPLKLLQSYTYGFGDLFHHYSFYFYIGYDNPTSNYPLTGYKQTHSYTTGYNPPGDYDGYYHYVYVPASLKTVRITDDTDIPANFFKNTNLETVEMPLVKNIGNGAFSGSKLVSVEIPDDIVSVGSSAFSGCPLKTVVTPVVESSLFSSSLEKLTLTAACTSLTSGCLTSATHLQELSLPFIGTSPTAASTLRNLFGGNVPASLKKLSLVRSSANIQIAESALAGLSQLTELVLSSNVRGLGRSALDGCNGLEHIYSHWANPPAAYNNSTFEGVNKYGCIIHVPVGVDSKNKYASADGWKEFYAANFWEEAAVTLVARPVPLYGGVIEGSLQHNYEGTATLTAGGNSGYVFQGWMEGETIVSPSATYTFTVTAPRTLYAVFAPRENENSVSVASQPTEVSIAWDGEAGASSYALVIYTDAARTQVYTTLRFDADGRPQQAPSLRAVQGRLSHTVDGLQAGADYYYSLTSYDAEGYALSMAAGSFKTPPVGIERVDDRKFRVYPDRATGSFRIEGLAVPAEVSVLDINGRTLFRKTIAGEASIAASHWQPGVYLVHANGATVKVVKTF
jgi:hypothetical protein